MKRLTLDVNHLDAKTRRPNTPPGSPRRFWIALGLIVLLALGLRLLPLAVQPPWMDEVASTIFSLGNSSRSVPINRLVDLHTFLQPLQGSGRLAPGAVIQHLLGEDNHPPLYFLLAHGWLRLVQPEAGLASIGLSRLLPALLGVAAVPLSAAVGGVALQSRRGALLAALWMAISPLALAQSLEIRQYSLAILLSTGSLLCLVKAWRLHQAGKILPIGWLLGWIAVNGAGVASHYFFVLGVLMQGAAIALLLRRNRRCWLALLGSLAMAALWLPVLAGFAGSGQSSWLRMDPSQPAALLAMVLQGLLGVLFAAVAPGTYAVHPWQWPFAVAAGLATLAGVALLGAGLRFTLLRRGQRQEDLQQERQPGQITAINLAGMEATAMLAVLVACGLAVQIAISLALLSDFTKGFRYSFFLIPTVVALLAALCEAQLASSSPLRRRRSIALLACGLVCALGVDAGAVLPKWYAGNLLAERIAHDSSLPIVLAYDHNPVGTAPTVIGHEPLSLAWWIGRHPERFKDQAGNAQSPRFVMAADGPGLPGARRQESLAAIAQICEPIDLWVIGSNPQTFVNPSCQLIQQGSEGSHLFIHYRCRG